MAKFDPDHTGMNVQTDLPKQEINEGEQLHETITCAACTKLHFINRENGRTDKQAALVDGLFHIGQGTVTHVTAPMNCPAYSSDHRS